MTFDTSSDSVRPTLFSRHLRRGGALLLVAGLVQLAGAVTLVIPSAQRLLPPVLQITAWGAGGFLLLAAALVLDSARSDQADLWSTIDRVALIVFGASGLLNLAVVVVGLTIGGGHGIALSAFVVEQVIVFLASTAVALRVLRDTALPAVARGVLIPLALVDAITLALSVASSTGALFLLRTYVLRPVLLSVAGGVFLLLTRYRASREQSHLPRQAPTSLRRAELSTDLGSVLVCLRQPFAGHSAASDEGSIHPRVSTDAARRPPRPRTAAEVRAV